MRLKSSSIYYALFLSVIISLFLGSMILFAGVNRQYSSQLDLQNRMIDNAHSGVAYGLANYSELQVIGPAELDLFGNKIDSVHVQAENWGAFHLIKSSAHHKSLSYSKIALAGKSGNSGLVNLYIPDHGRPISICGDTRLEGKLSIPKAGVDRAYIEGQNYQGKELVYGASTISSSTLPPVNQGFLDGMLEFDAEIRTWETMDSVNVSFDEKAIHFIDDNIVSLNHEILGGQLILEARDSIFVGMNAKLEDVILKSAVIYIESGFVGNLQCYASERIVLEEGVTLKYPSVLGLIEEQSEAETSSQILIGKDSQVIGSVFAISENPNFRYPVQVAVGEGARVDGLLYCSGRTELQGTVNGHLYTNKFYLETPSSKYENHVLNGQVLNQLPDDFVVIPLLEDNSVLTQIDWLK